jgi:hypothetical protein
MLPEVSKDDDFPQLSSERRLVNISGTVTAIYLKLSQVVKDMGLLVLIEGSTAAAPLPWWPNLELNEYLRNQVSK